MLPENTDTVPFQMFIDEIEGLLSKFRWLERKIDRIERGGLRRSDTAKSSKPKLSGRGYDKMLNNKIMNGADLPLAQTLHQNPSSPKSTSSPRDLKEDVKSPREGPLKWDADSRKWCQNVQQTKATDLAINTLLPSTITTSQKDNFLKDQKHQNL